MRQILRFGGTFIITLAAYALLLAFGVEGELGRIYVSTLLVLFFVICGDVCCYVLSKLPISKYDVAADLYNLKILYSS